MDNPKRFTNWFYAATIYNVGWGLIVLLIPNWMIEKAGVGNLISAPFLQAIGMMVGVYGYGFYLLARDPVRYSGFIWVGLLGKIFGLAGFLYYASTGVLPWNFGFSILTNDLIWIPAFTIFAWKYARKPL